MLEIKLHKITDYNAGDFHVPSNNIMVNTEGSLSSPEPKNISATSGNRKIMSTASLNYR